MLRELVPELSQRELDALAGLHPGHVWQIEEGHRENSKRETARGLAHALGSTVGWILEGEGKPPAPAAVLAAIERARAAKQPRTGTEG